MINGTYVSSDAVERAEAFRLGYAKVCQHPKEIGVLEPDELLTIDFDHVLFDDKDLAVRKANEAANRGVPVGIHTYYPTDPRLERFLALPNVRVAKTHRHLLALMDRPARNQDPEPVGRGSRPASLYEEVADGCDDPD
jgi:hypothetical protein